MNVFYKNCLLQGTVLDIRRKNRVLDFEPYMWLGHSEFRIVQFCITPTRQQQSSSSRHKLCYDYPFHNSAPLTSTKPLVSYRNGQLFY